MFGEAVHNPAHVNLDPGGRESIAEYPRRLSDNSQLQKIRHLKIKTG